jgi:SAM-dependent methyltransferase
MTGWGAQWHLRGSTLNHDLTVLRCPETGSLLRKSQDDTLLSDSGSRYPIVNGIPRFVETENYASDFGKQWNAFRETQLDSRTGISITGDRLARCMNGHLEHLKGKRVLEAGSGAGRFTEILLRHCPTLHSFDFSSAVDANAANNGSSDRLTLVQGDIRRIPFEPDTYDYVICLGVLQHTPDPEESIRCLWEMVRPGGRLIIDHYRPTLWLRLPPPLGNAEKIYRWAILRLPAEKRYLAVKRLTDFWFPIYWRYRESKWAQRILARVAGIHFYYGQIPLRTREEHYQWALLDTHDGMTDHFKHYRDEHQIRRTLEELGAVDIRLAIAGNGVEAECRKPEGILLA